MDNSNTPSNAPFQSPEQETVAPASQQPTENRSKKINKILLITCILVLLVLIPLAYAIGRTQTVNDLANNISTDTSSTSDTKPVDTT